MSKAQRTIIVGVDYSDPSVYAVDEALRLVTLDPAARMLVLLALPGPSQPLPSDKQFTEDLVARSKENLLRLVSARARALGVQPPYTEPRIAFGEAFQCLLEEAREHAAALIVVGTHGRRGLPYLLLGSVAERVVREATCSVLVARAPATAQLASGAKPEAGLPLGAGLAAPDVAEEASEGPDTDVDPESVMVLSEPYLDAGHVLLRVLDVPTGQLFLCAFADLETVRVEPIEGGWVPPPSSAARVRAARTARAEARAEPGLFQPLFEALAREKIGSSG